MTDTPTTTPNRRKRATAILAIGAGAALLVGGGTFALWTAGDSLSGGTITAGNLDVQAISAPTWQDVTENVEGTPRAITLSDFRIVPGDTIEGTFGIDAALQGDNLTAVLSVGLTGSAGQLLADTNGVSLTYSVQEADGTAIPGLTDIAVGTPSTITFASADNPNAGSLPTLPAATDGTADLRVIVTAVFDEATPDQVRVLQSLDLGAISVTLTQQPHEAAAEPEDPEAQP